MKTTTKAAHSAIEGIEVVKTKNFGLHLTIDGYGCSEKALGDMEHVFRVLDELPGHMGMHKIITPYVVRADESGKKDPGGFSGFVMIQESHISVHTFPKRRFVSIDVYSCTNFDTKEVEQFVTNAFGIEERETNVIARGTRYPMQNVSSKGK